MNIGILGGGFNPITYGHLLLIAEVLNSKKVDCVWLIPSPLRPDKNSLVNEEHRLAMCRLALDSFFDVNDKVILKDDEIYDKEFLGTFELLNKLKTKINSDDKLFFIIGTDNLKNIPNWKNPTELISKNNFLVLQRGGEEISKDLPYDLTNFTFIDNVSSNISATEVRNRIKENRSILGLTPKPVIEYIKEHKLYL